MSLDVPRVLTWRRTVIGGRIIPNDIIGKPPTGAGFCRVEKQTSSPHNEPWSWVANGTHHIASGFEATLDEAMAAAEKAYIRWFDAGRAAPADLPSTVIGQGTPRKRGSRNWAVKKPQG